MKSALRLAGPTWTHSSWHRGCTPDLIVRYLLGFLLSCFLRVLCASAGDDVAPGATAQQHQQQQQPESVKRGWKKLADVMKIRLRLEKRRPPPSQQNPSGEGQAARAGAGKGSGLIPTKQAGPRMGTSPGGNAESVSAAAPPALPPVPATIDEIMEARWMSSQKRPANGSSKQPAAPPSPLKARQAQQQQASAPGPAKQQEGQPTAAGGAEMQPAGANKAAAGAKTARAAAPSHPALQSGEKGKGGGGSAPPATPVTTQEPEQHSQQKGGSASAPLAPAAAAQESVASGRGPVTVAGPPAQQGHLSMGQREDGSSKGPLEAPLPSPMPPPIAFDYAANMFLTRMAFDLLRNPGFKAQVQERVQRNLSRLKTPDYVTSLQVRARLLAWNHR
jgi:hypothetical protein